MISLKRLQVLAAQVRKPERHDAAGAQQYVRLALAAYRQYFLSPTHQVLDRAVDYARQALACGTHPDTLYCALEHIRERGVQ